MSDSKITCSDEEHLFSSFCTEKLHNDYNIEFDGKKSIDKYLELIVKRKK